MFTGGGGQWGRLIEMGRTGQKYRQIVVLIVEFYRVSINANYSDEV